VSIEKDWVPEISKDYADHGWLTQTNVQMRQIDLGCKVIAPVFAGIVVAWGGDDMKVRNRPREGGEGGRAVTKKHESHYLNVW
jgi:hypothetical protein